MSALAFLRSNWRVLLLALLIVGSLYALFAPGGEATTNLEYGIQLEGGARISAPPVGMTAEDVALTPDNADAVEDTVARELGVDRIDVAVSLGERSRTNVPTVEVFDANVSESAFVDALQAAGLEATADDVRAGVTAGTRQEMVRTIEDKIRESALSGGSASVSRAGDRHYIVVEAPDRDVGELRELIASRGVVEVNLYYERNGSYVNETVIAQQDRANYQVSAPQYSEEHGHHVTVTFTDDATAERFQTDMRDAGYTTRTTCDFQGYNGTPPGQKCLITVFDGQVVDFAGVSSGLARMFAEETFVNNPQFLIETADREEARNLQIALRAGRLPTTLDFAKVDAFSLQPALAERFKTNSVVVGLLAVIAVSLVVYLRYDEIRIALPMVVTALSEVVILLGFAAATGYPLTLSVIAGFIAVIGTGVDDLVIIADEVMAEQVNSARVFKSRFRKALWTIGAAAATTIVAMTPLAVPWLNLGDLQGFAIVTIVGVLVGVLVTRPAYGDVLRALLTDR